MAVSNANNMIQLPNGIDANWDQTVGGFILNCGAVEFSLIRLAEVISRNPEKRQIALQKLLNGRIELVRKLTKNSDISEFVQTKINKTLDAVAELTKTRNTVAHNPFVAGVDARGNPARGILDVKRVKGEGPFEVVLLSLADILSSAHRARELAEELQRIISSIDQEREESNGGLNAASESVVDSEV